MRSDDRKLTITMGLTNANQGYGQQFNMSMQVFTDAGEVFAAEQDLKVQVGPGVSQTFDWPIGLVHSPTKGAKIVLSGDVSGIFNLAWD
jgi:hypothetical protein